MTSSSSSLKLDSWIGRGFRQELVSYKFLVKIASFTYISILFPQIIVSKLISKYATCFPIKIAEIIEIFTKDAVKLANKNFISFLFCPKLFWNVREFGGRNFENAYDLTI